MEVNEMSNINGDGVLWLKCIVNQKQKLIEDFINIKKRIMIAMEERYGKTAKGLEYLENLFKDEIKALENREGSEQNYSS